MCRRQRHQESLQPQGFDLTISNERLTTDDGRIQSQSPDRRDVILLQAFDDVQIQARMAAKKMFEKVTNCSSSDRASYPDPEHFVSRCSGPIGQSEQLIKVGQE